MICINHNILLNEMVRMVDDKQAQEIETVVSTEKKGAILHCVCLENPQWTSPKRRWVKFQTHQRLGIKAEIPPLNKRSQLSVRTDYDKTFRVRAAQLFNLLPAALGSITSLDAFKF